MAQPAAAPAVKYKGVQSAVSESSGGSISFVGRLTTGLRRTLGSYSSAEAAAHAYDLAALAANGPHTETNFPASTYTQADIDAAAQQLHSHTPNVKTSQYVGVRRKHGRKLWDARIRRNYVRAHLGYYTTEQDAAVQYDLAQMVLHGQEDPATCTKTNFDWSDVPAATIDSMTANVRLRMSGKLQLPGTASSEQAAGGDDQQQQPRQVEQQQQQQQQARGPSQAVPQQQQQQQVVQQLEHQQRQPAEQQQQGTDSDSSDEAAAQQQQQRQRRQRRVEKRLDKAERRLKRLSAARKEAKQRAKQLQLQLQELQQQVEQLQQQGRSMRQDLKAAKQAVRAAKQVMTAARQQQE